MSAHGPRRRALCLGFGAWALGGAGLGAADRIWRERRSFALGTVVCVQAMADDAAAADRACGAALQAIHRVDRLMSLYDSHSEIARLNRQGWLSRPDPWTLAVLERAQGFAVATDGAFDVTVQPLWRLFSAHADRGTLPSAADVEAVCRLVGWRGLQASAAGLRLAQPGMAVTVNGIAQGFAADRAAEAMRAAGAVAGLVDAGELASLGAAPSGGPWSVALQAAPGDGTAWIAPGACVATSADSPSSFTPDRRHHHIVDPRAGWSPMAFSAVSVVAASATLADAWSTAVMVGGAALARRALALGDAQRIRVVDKQGRARWLP